MHNGALSCSSAKEATGAFATTHWSVVLDAQNESSPLADSALESLCRAYWYPVYAYVRRRGYDVPSAQDLTQEFFAQVLAKQLLAAVDPRKGRFRSWLLGVMNHFLAHEWARARAQKRGGGCPVLSWDELEAEERYRLEPAEEPSPARVFDRRWAFTVLERAASRLRREYAEAGNWRVYGCLRDFVANEAANVRTEKAARELGMSISATKSAIHRLRRRYQELVRAEIAETVGSESESTKKSGISWPWFRTGNLSGAPCRRVMSKAHGDAALRKKAGTSPRDFGKYRLGRTTPLGGTCKEMPRVQVVEPR